MGREPGILAYGHFTLSTPHYALPNKRDYGIFIHTTDDYDILDFFTYGGLAFKPIQVTCSTIPD
jgi:hypothetical protein